MVHVVNLEIAVRNEIELHALWINNKINLAYIQNVSDKSLSIWFWDCRWYPLVEVCLLCLVAETVNWWILDCLCLDEWNNCQQRARLSSFVVKFVCQGIEPIPQIFDSSSMLSYSIDIQLPKILRPWNTVGFEIFQLPKVWVFLNHPCWM